MRGKKIAFDTSILIYQFVIAIRNSGIDLTNDRGDITSHIHATIMKTRKYLNDHICPIFVFDGKPPAIKLNTLHKRSETRNNAVQGLKDKNITCEEKIKLLKQSVVITGKQMEECKEVLKLMTKSNGIFVSGKFELYKKDIPYYAFKLAFNEFNI